MFKKIITSTIICILMQSCNSQKKDLAQITFTEKLDTFFGEIPNKLDKDYSIVDPQLYNSYKSESEKILYFNGVDLSGYLDKKGEYGTNNIRFEFSKQDNLLNFYHVQLYTNDKISLLIEALNGKLGKPNYINVLESNKKSPDALLWEDKTSFYLITGATQNQSDFIVFNKNNTAIRKQWISASFMYYGDYLDYLEKKGFKKESYSYKNFADDKNKDGYDRYLKNYKKP
ncbi:hypothetical protein [Flavobacterium chungangensis]|uniref:Lipoprotein n=1 Tax=Flavobacterium chungangensis TaxID=2708132 RepID=A0ABV8ZK09_9FLAO